MTFKNETIIVTDRGLNSKFNGADGGRKLDEIMPTILFSNKRDLLRLKKNSFCGLLVIINDNK